VWLNGGQEFSECRGLHELRAQGFHACTVIVIEAGQLRRIDIPRAGSVPSAYGSDEPYPGSAAGAGFGTLDQ